MKIQKRKYITPPICQHSQQLQLHEMTSFLQQDWMNELHMVQWYIVCILVKKFLQPFLWALHVRCRTDLGYFQVRAYVHSWHIVFCWTRLWMNDFLLVKMLVISPRFFHYINTKPQSPASQYRSGLETIIINYNLVSKLLILIII